MAFKFKRRYHKIITVVVVSLIALVLIVAIFVNMYWSPILAKKLRDVVLTSSNGLYKADFSDAELHVLRGSIVLYNITLTPDSTVYKRLLAAHLAPNNLVNLRVKKLILSHVHPFKLYFEHKVDINKIVLSSPELDVSYQLNHTKDTVTKDNRTVWQKISKSLHSIHVDQVFLNDVKLKYNDYSGHKVEISELREMNLGASDMMIDSATQTDKSRLLFCKEIVAELNNYKGTSPRGLYDYEIRHLKLSTLTSDLQIEGLVMRPANKGKFFDKSKKDRFTIRVDSVDLKHFDYLNYHKYRTLSVSKILISHGSFDLFKNPNSIKKSGENGVKTFPNAILHSLTTDIQIDTMTIKDFNISYSEYNKKSFQSGSITFTSTYGNFLNITNNKAALLKNNLCIADLHSKFMNTANLDVNFTLNLTAVDNAYSYKGSLGTMNLQAVNPATMPFAMVKVTSGSIKSFNFNIQANNMANKGKVVLLYNDLKVKLLKPDTEMAGFKGKMIETLFANIFILKHDNPDQPGGIPRSFNVSYIRPAESPFFKTIWHTLLSGIKPSIGMDDKTMAATQAKMTQNQLNKQERLQKRAARKARRAAKEQQKALAKKTNK